MSTNESIFQNLEKTIVTYKKLKSVKIKESGETFVRLSKEGSIASGYLPCRQDMKNIVKGIVVRKSVSEKLTLAQNNLRKYDPTLSLYVTYGYRSLNIQKQRFVTQLSCNMRYFANPSDLYEETHRYVAVPSVAGHPTGGAIDVVIKKGKKILNFGSKQYDYSNKNCYVYSPFVSTEAKVTRMLLREVLMDQGFAPFDGEWWHFSYGDKEWAYYYQKNNAIYTQIDEDHIKKIVI